MEREKGLCLAQAWYMVACMLHAYAGKGFIMFRGLFLHSGSYGLIQLKALFCTACKAIGDVLGLGPS